MKQKKYIILALLATAIYFSLAIFLLNPSLVLITILSQASLLSKLSLLFAVLESSWVTLHHLDFFLLLTTSTLVGINVAISFALIHRLKKLGRVNFALGSGTMVGVFSAGCATCGFSAFSLFGFSGVVAFIPLQGIGLYALAITLLIFSLYYNITSLKKPLVCKK